MRGWDDSPHNHDDFETIRNLNSKMSELRVENEQLRKALEWLLHETMYKDHPEASQNAMDVLGIKK